MSLPKPWWLCLRGWRGIWCLIDVITGAKSRTLREAHWRAVHRQAVNDERDRLFDEDWPPA